MPENARVLHFRSRPGTAPLSRVDVERMVGDYLAVPISSRTVDLRRCLGNVDIIFGLCAELRERCEVEPAKAAEEASDLYDSLAGSSAGLGLFDERDYVLGDAALIAGTAFRHIGQRQDSERWLNRAENAFLHTVNPAPLLAKVSYARLTLWHDTHRFGEILERAPGLAMVFDRLGMARESAKCQLIEAIALREVGKTTAALDKLRSLTEPLAAAGNFALLGTVLMKSGEFHALDGSSEEALRDLEEALPHLDKANRPMMIAQAKFIVGGILRDSGQLQRAMLAYRAAIEGYRALRMQTWAAYTGVFLAETLLLAGRPREAEWEILAALPTIEEQKMVPEGLAAVALLRESVRRRKTDSNALRELREHLQAKS